VRRLLALAAAVAAFRNCSVLSLIFLAS